MMADTRTNAGLPARRLRAANRGFVTRSGQHSDRPAQFDPAEDAEDVEAARLE